MLMKLQQRRRTLPSRVLGTLGLTLLLSAPIGCEDEGGEEKKEEAAEEKKEEKKEEKAEEKKEGGDAEAAAMPTDDDLAKEAEASITADNAEEQADALAKELEAELGEE